MPRLVTLAVLCPTDDNRTMLTMEGLTLGTPAYMSPEQIRADDNIDIRSDIYGLGIILYHCLSGETPFGGSVVKFLRGHIHDTPPDISLKRPDVSAATKDLLMQAIDKNPAR